MIFGNKSDFAIEAMIEPYLEPPSEPWGRLCIWVAGNQIGNYSDPHCGLYSCYVGFREKCELLDSLWIDLFQSLRDQEIWNFLDSALYGYHGNIELDDERTLEQMRNDSEELSRFDFVTQWGEMFDRGGKAFILRLPSGLLKILSYDYQRDTVTPHICSAKSFCRAAEGFTKWYSNQVRLLNPN